MRIFESFEYSSNITFEIFVFDSKIVYSKSFEYSITSNIRKIRICDSIIMHKITRLPHFCCVRIAKNVAERSDKHRKYTEARYLPATSAPIRMIYCWCISDVQRCWRSCNRTFSILCGRNVPHYHSFTMRDHF